jgi:hypothetical protein
MGQITRDLEIHGVKGTKFVKNVLFDGIASHSFMRLGVCKLIEDLMPFVDSSGKRMMRIVTLADGETQIPTIGTCTFDTIINDIDVRDEAWVSENLGKDLIIGADTMQ